MSRSVYGGGGGGADWDTRERPRTVTKTVYKVPDNIARSSAVGGVNEEKTEDKIIIRRTHRDDDGPSWNSRDTHSHDDLNVRITERTQDNRSRTPQDDYRVTERVTYDRDYDRDSHHTHRDIPYRTGGQSTFQRNDQRNDDWDDRRTTISRYTGRDDNRRNDNYSSDYKANYSSNDYKANYSSEYRVVDREREYQRAPSPPRESVREFRFERERDYSPERRREPQYDVERYSKETEYYTQPAPALAPAPQPIIIQSRSRTPPPAPQPIIIREIERARDPQPIIIREERRPEPQYEFIERQEVSEEKSLVRREEPPPPAVISEHPQQQQQDESYFYERRVREVDRSRRREESNDRRTEIRPRDSASNYSSDDSYEYVRREKTYYDDERDSHHRRHLAEGALAGAAGAAILRHHRKSEGKDGGNRFGSALAGAGVGALGAEAITRYRSKSRKRGGSRSRSRSRSSDYDSRRDRRDRRRKRRSRSRSRTRSGSRSKSLSRKQQLAVGAGLAGVAALAGYALKNRNKGETVIVNEAGPPPRDRRSRSRRRRGSPDSYMMDDEPPRALAEGDKHRDEGHRNQRIAQAGLASAAAAGIYERYRSKSRGKSKGRGKERSKSRVKTGVPIAAAGLGGAALAGLYEKNKASKEAKKDAVIADEVGRGRRHRSRSRTYGDDPVYPEDRSRGYYSDEEPGVFRRRGRGGSRSSYGSSPDTRKRSSSRGRNLAAAAGAAGLGAVAGHEYNKRKDRKRSEEAERRREQDMAEDYRYDDRYRDSPDPYNQPSGYLPQQNDQYAPQQSYPGGLHFQPPPTAPAGEPVYAPRGEQYPQAQQQQAPYPAYNPSTYNPADYAQPGATPQPHPYDATRGAYGDSEATLGAPYGGGETYAGDPRYPPQAESPREERRRGGRPDPENVSAPTSREVPAPTPTAGSVADDERSAHDADRVDVSTEGTRTPRARSSSRVRFDLGANTALSPEAPRRRKESSDTTKTSDENQQSSDRRRRGSGRKRHRDRDRDTSRRGSSDLMNDKYERAPRSTTDEGESEGTVDLPDRFDERGEPKKDDPLNDLISGLASRFLGGEQGRDEDEGGRGRRSRH